MGSIPKIVSTPLKWVSKKVLHSTLLRFPGGDPQSPVACVYCPEMCRFSCPTAVVSGNDAVTPCNKMGLLYKEEKWPGQVSQGAPLWPIYDCTGCGRCTEYCVYEMPVTQRLFDARQKWKWSVAEEAAAALTEAEDPVGDLAYELGDKKVALGRLQGWNSNFVDEPKSLQFVLDQGRSASLTLDSLLQAENLSEFALQKLKGKTWLFHESVWFSRHLKRWEEIPVWIDKARKAGIQLRRPFAHGMDCIDCGGEGAYSRLFPDQAAKMAAEFWERDAHRADGILCVSSRCAAHLRKSFGSKITIVAFSELLGG